MVDRSRLRSDLGVSGRGKARNIMCLSMKMKLVTDLVDMYLLTEVWVNKVNFSSRWSMSCPVIDL